MNPFSKFTLNGIHQELAIYTSVIIRECYYSYVNYLCYRVNRNVLVQLKSSFLCLMLKPIYNANSHRPFTAQEEK